MTFTVSSKAVNDALTMLSKVIASKNVLPILDDFIFRLEGDTLHLTASDIENTMNTFIGVTEGDGKDGSFAINARSMMDALRNMPEMPMTFSFEESNNSLRISYQNGLFSLPTERTDDFPAITPVNENEAFSITIPENILQENIARTVFATAQEQLVPVMNGILFELKEESLNIVASDGHQLVRNRIFSITAGEENSGSFILPKKPAHIMKNILHKTDEEVSVKSDGQRAEFVTSTFTLSCRLIDGRYPNYNSVIPKDNPNRLTADRNSLMAVLKRMTPFANNTSLLMKLHVEPQALRIETEDYDLAKTAEESMTASYDGKAMKIGFKSTTLLGILDNIKAEEIEIQLADPSRAALILPSEQPEQQEIVMLIMPMLLND